MGTSHKSVKMTIYFVHFGNATEKWMYIHTKKKQKQRDVEREWMCETKILSVINKKNR